MAQTECGKNRVETICMLIEELFKEYSDDGKIIPKDKMKQMCEKEINCAEAKAALQKKCEQMKAMNPERKKKCEKRFGDCDGVNFCQFCNCLMKMVKGNHKKLCGGAEQDDDDGDECQ